MLYNAPPDDNDFGRLVEHRRRYLTCQPAANPAFDVTPARLVTGLITERGVCDASEAGLAGLFPERAAAPALSRQRWRHRPGRGGGGQVDPPRGAPGQGAAGGGAAGDGSRDRGDGDAGRRARRGGS